MLSTTTNKALRLQSIAQFSVHNASWIAYVGDAIFKKLPKTEAPQFEADLLAAIPAGANLELVLIPFFIGLQKRGLARLEGNCELYAVDCRDAIQNVVVFLQTFDVAGLAAGLAAGSAAWTAAKSALIAHPGGAASETAAAAAQSAAWATSAAKGSGTAAAEAAFSAANSAGPASAPRSTAIASRAAEWRAQRDCLLSLVRLHTASI